MINKLLSPNSLRDVSLNRIFFSLRLHVYVALFRIHKNENWQCFFMPSVLTLSTLL